MYLFTKPKVLYTRQTSSGEKVAYVTAHDLSRLMFWHAQPEAVFDRNTPREVRLRLLRNTFARLTGDTGLLIVDAYLLFVDRTTPVLVVELTDAGVQIVRHRTSILQEIAPHIPTSYPWLWGRLTDEARKAIVADGIVDPVHLND